MLSNKPDALQTLDRSLFRLVNDGGENKLFRVKNDCEGQRLQFLDSISVAMREPREIAIVSLRRVFYGVYHLKHTLQKKKTFR